MLYTIATVLNVEIQYFIEGFNNNNHTNSLKEESSPIYEVDMRNKKESLDLLKAYYSISDLSVRKKVLELVKAFSHSSKKKSTESEE